LNAHATALVYQGASQNTGGVGLPAVGLPAGFYGSASVSSSNGQVVMVVNEAAPSQGMVRSGTYAASSTNTGQIGLPIVANSASDGYTSGLTVLNSGDSATSGTISYYWPDGTLVTNATQTFSIAAHASQPFYQAAVAGLPVGFYGSAALSGNGLLVTTNVQSANLFFTYTEPT
jgi:hypothetical protein